MAWTDKMVEELKKLWNMGITTGEIGKRLGISKNSIVGKVHRLGLEGRPSPIKKSGEPSEKESKPTKKSTASKKNTTEKTSKPAEKKNKSITEVKEKEVATPEKKVEKKLPETKSAPTKNKPVVDEDDIKLIKSLDVKTDKDCQKENISLTELDNHTCRWPLGDPKDADFHFCGHKVKTGQTYCEEHSAIAYVKPTRR